VPFSVTVRACDNSWNTVTSVTNSIQILSSDQSADLPSPAQLTSGVGTFTLTLNAGGQFNIYAHDQTDNTIPDGASPLVTVFVLAGFDFSSIQRHQDVGVPFSVTITALDPSGNVATGFSGAVRIDQLTSFGVGRTSPAVVTFSQGRWSGGIACYRADESNHPRGNVNLYAFVENAPSINGTSGPFIVHNGPFRRVQIIVPGETALPGSLSGRTGTPATQAAGRGFTVSVQATDNYWNPVGSNDQVRITSSDNAANTPVQGSLSNGFRQFTIILGTVGTQTLTVQDQTNGTITPMTTDGITVIPSSAQQFVIETIPSPVAAGSAVPITIRAADLSGNTVPDYNADARLSANTGPGSMSPELISFQNGIWSGDLVFYGAGGSVRVTCSDFAAPPHTGTSNPFTVDPGPLAKLQVLLPGETPRGGTADGQEGTPVDQPAGSTFTVTVRACDNWWNMVTGVNDRIDLGSTDAFAHLPAETTLVNGQVLIPSRLFRSGSQTIWASDLDQAQVEPDTSSAVQVVGGSFARLLILAPGEEPAPGTVTGRTGTATDQSINYSFTVQVLATDSWWNPVGGVSDVVHITCTDPGATLPPDAALVDGQASLNMRLATGGFQQITVSDVTDPSKTGSVTQVRAISSGFHLEAEVPPTGRAGEPFTLTVRVVNDAGSVIQEINSFVTIEVQNASTRLPGRGTLLTTRFQLLQGERSISETYTFAEPIILIARDDAGNAPGVTDAIVIAPGIPSAIQLSSNPSWVRANKHATVSARLVDDFDNGVPGQSMVFSLLSGTGTLTPVDSLTSDTGVATADYLSARVPETSRIRAQSNSLTAEFDLVTALVDPTAGGGTVTNYPNPFHPDVGPTTIAYKLDDAASVTLRIFSLSGELVRKEDFPAGSAGGLAGLNQFEWDGENGDGSLVASGGYVVLVEAKGGGETLHVMRRKIAVVR
jgi:hypothetical protein